MATRGTKQRVIRVTDEVWEAYGRACMSLGTSRSGDLRQHIYAQIKVHEAEQRRVAAEERRALSRGLWTASGT